MENIQVLWVKGEAPDKPHLIIRKDFGEELELSFEQAKTLAKVIAAKIKNVGR